MEAMVEAFMEWRASRSADGWGDTLVPDSPAECETLNIHVVNVFRDSDLTFSLLEGESSPVALLQHGAIPCAPLRPTVAVSLRTMEIYRLQRLRCPKLLFRASFVFSATSTLYLSNHTSSSNLAYALTFTSPFWTVCELV